MTLLVPLTIQAATPNSVNAKSEIDPPTQRSGVYQSPLTLTFRVGAFSYIDSIYTRTDRFLGGVQLDWMPAFSIAPATGVFLGLQTGVFSSHTGAVGPGFLGHNRGNNIGVNSNVFLVPLNLVIHYQITGHLMAALNVGANAVYRTVSNQVILGHASDFSTGGSTEFLPDIGLTLGIALSPTFGLSIRADYLQTPNHNGLYTTTLGATIPLA